MMTSVSRGSRLAMAFAALMVLGVAVAEARAGRGGGFGSRGSRTFDAPAATTTAPRPTAPLQRSMTQPGQPGMQRSATAAPAAAPSRFGFGTGLLAGLAGAGLIGMLMGNGFLGGLSGLASIFGLLLQVGLIMGLIWLAMRWFRSRSQPALAGVGAAQQTYARSAPGGLGSVIPGLGGGASAAQRGTGPAGDAVGIGEADYKSFERLLGDIQTAYGREDLAALRAATTPEMVSFLAEDLADNAKSGVVNAVSEPRLLQGDLAEAWREADADYATVAMRFSIVDVTTDRASGKVVDGDAETPVEVTEVWTFRRARGDDWKLSAIQQA